MKIYNNSPNINFNAKFIKKTPVKKFTLIKYNKKDVSLVELVDSKDIDTLHNMGWNIPLLSGTINHLRKHIDELFNHKLKSYVLTTQEKDFEDLIPSKILGIVDVTNDPELKQTTINYLLTNPKYIDSKYSKKIRFSNFIHSLCGHPKEYKGIGKALIHNIIELSPFEDFYLSSDIRATSFYKKIGFTQISKSVHLSDYEGHPRFWLKSKK